MRVVFDLDGTLICSRERLYRLFLSLTKDSSIDYRLYWSCKFNGDSNQDILRKKLNYSEREVDCFVQSWLDLVESDYYLKMDMAIPGAVEFLEDLSEDNELYLCTSRQSISQTYKQLEDLNLLSFFQRVFVTEQKISKFELLKKSNIAFTNDDWLVGDTGHDIVTGKEIGVKTCAVLSGFMSSVLLTGYLPDMIVQDVTHINW